MSRKHWAILLLLLCPSFAHADAPKAVVVAPKSALLPGQSFLLSAADSTADVVYPVEWLSLDTRKPEWITFDKSGKRDAILFVQSAEPGEYLIACKVRGRIKGVDGQPDTIDTDLAVVRIVVREPPPPPPVPPTPPGPNPPDPPTPPTPLPVVTGKIFATYLADAANVLPSHAAMKQASTIRKAFETLDASWRWYQSDESEPKTLKLLDHVDSFPCVVIQGKDGKILDVLKAPSEADVIAKVKALRGVTK